MEKGKSIKEMQETLENEAEILLSIKGFKGRRESFLHKTKRIASFLHNYVGGGIVIFINPSELCEVDFQNVRTVKNISPFLFFFNF